MTWAGFEKQTANLTNFVNLEESDFLDLNKARGRHLFDDIAVGSRLRIGLDSYSPTDLFQQATRTC